MTVAAVLNTGLALVFVASCAGWGRLVEQCVRVKVDGGLMLAWGLAAVLAVGGGAVALGAATAPVLVGIEMLGLCALLLLPRLRLPVIDRPTAAFAVIAAAMLLIRLLAAAGIGAYEPCDDTLAYQPLVQQLLQAGDLVAPFSLRRLAAYGGHTLLQAMVTPNGDPAALPMVDSAVAPIFLLGLAWSFLARHGRPQVLPLAVSLLFGLGLILRVNTASQTTSLVCFLTVARTLYLVIEAERRTLLCVVVGLAAAAAVSLRHLNLPFPALLMLAFLPGHVARRGWRPALTDGCVTAASWLAFLAPWMMALYASSGTPLYPLFKGFHIGSVDYASASLVGGWRQVAIALWETLALGPMLIMVVFIPLAFLVPRDRPLRLIQLAAVAGAAIIVAAFPAAGSISMARYMQPTLATAFLLSVISAFATGVISSRLARIVVALLVVPLLGMIAYREVSGLIAAKPREPFAQARYGERMAAYAEAQGRIPVGQPIFVYVSTPYAFDAERNRIHNADEPGPVSPPPGLPFFRGAEAVAAYLRGLGIDHVAFEDFDTAVTWCIGTPGMDDLHEQLWQPWKPYLADLRDNLHELARTRRVEYDAHGVTLVDLSQPAR